MQAHAYKSARAHIIYILSSVSQRGVCVCVFMRINWAFPERI